MFGTPNPCRRSRPKRTGSEYRTPWHPEPSVFLSHGATGLRLARKTGRQTTRLIQHAIGFVPWGGFRSAALSHRATALGSFRSRGGVAAVAPCNARELRGAIISNGWTRFRMRIFLILPGIPSASFRRRGFSAIARRNFERLASFRRADTGQGCCTVQHPISSFRNTAIAIGSLSRIAIPSWPGFRHAALALSHRATARWVRFVGRPSTRTAVAPCDSATASIRHAVRSARGA